MPPRDATAPRIRLLSPGRQKLSRLRGRGLAFRIGVDEPASLTVTLRGTARRLSRRLARVQVRRVAAGRAVTVRLRPSKAPRKRLKRERRLPALLTVRAVDLAGNATTRTKRLVFRR